METTSERDPGFPAVDSIPRWAWVTGLVAGATLLGLIESAQVQFDRSLQNAPITWPHALIHGLPRWYSWALLAPLVVAATARIERARSGWSGSGRLQAGGLHLALGLAITVAQVGLYAAASTLLHGGPDPWSHLQPKFETYLGLTYLGGLVTYALIVSAWYGWLLLGRLREGERAAAQLDLQASELETLLVESRLQHLQSQLQPHFLFNTLHAVSGLVTRGRSRDAVRLTTRLSELLRGALRLSEHPEVPLVEELRLLEDYLEVQRLRFGERLDATVHAEPGVERALVPTLILQPLVENAVRHGLETDPGAGRIEVRAGRVGDRLLLEITDDGPGLRSPDPEEGLGVGTTRERLERLYGSAADFRMEPGEEGGTRVRLRIPYREAGS